MPSDQKTVYTFDLDTLLETDSLEEFESSCERLGGHGGRVVTLSPPTCEAEVRFPAQPQVGSW